MVPNGSALPPAGTSAAGFFVILGRLSSGQLGASARGLRRGLFGTGQCAGAAGVGIGGVAAAEAARAAARARARAAAAAAAAMPTHRAAADRAVTA